MAVQYKYELATDVTERGLKKLLKSLGLVVAKEIVGEMLAVSHRTRRTRINAMLDKAVKQGIIKVAEDGTIELTNPVIAKAKKIVKAKQGQVVEEFSEGYEGEDGVGKFKIINGQKVYKDVETLTEAQEEAAITEQVQDVEAEELAIAMQGAMLGEVIDGLTSRRSYAIFALHKKVPGAKVVTNVSEGGLRKTKFYPALNKWMTEETLAELTGGKHIDRTHNTYQRLMLTNRELAKLIDHLREQDFCWCLTDANLHNAIIGATLDWDEKVRKVTRFKMADPAELIANYNLPVETGDAALIGAVTIDEDE